ncbi:complex I assembly factor ACAD9, mitochondrial [Topomyia yanbarensis]|uniref:complex I assembly factor ACAD9, mitochondrial n=1 Tax=Topomyia yanbarensis TaxID=2498891 RepID=UPI00273CE3A5|nr:complex I assembly factor ACAD9, mitochondrial [Topomyia yanbarensis]
MLSVIRTGLAARLRGNLPSSSRWKSTLTSQKQTEDYGSSDGDIKINTKPEHQRLDKREPLMKNMFVGVVDTDLLVYPESLNRDEQSRLVSERKHLEQLLKNDEAANLETLTKRAGIFGLQSPLNYGGKQLIETELAYFNEIISKDFPTALIVGQHNAIIQLLNKFTSDRLKDKCLEELSSGQKIVSSAMLELKAPNGTMFSTLANLGTTNKSWLLNGSKSFVLNGDKSGYLLVFASTKTIEHMNENDTTVTAFLVDAHANGVKRTSLDETLGLNGVKQATFTFENVELTDDDIVGTEGKGAQILVELLKSTRIQTSVLGVQMMKKVLNKVTKYCIETKCGDGHLMEIENIREELSRSLCSIYAAESMIYLTLGLLDDFNGQDTDMEVAITKIFTTEKLLQLTLMPLRFIGPQALVKGNEFESVLRDSIQFANHAETLDSIKLFVALTGAQHAGMASYKTIKKDRNPAMNPSHVWSKLFEKNTIDTPKKFINLEHYFHPSLEPTANRIELSIARLKLATECCLSRHGIELIKRHIELVRLADIAALIYAMVATASRASRSYCIGLAHGDQEIHLAHAFCLEASETVKRLAKELERGQFITNDSNYDAMARYFFRQKEYFFEHPLTKNY